MKFNRRIMLVVLLTAISYVFVPVLNGNRQPTSASAQTTDVEDILNLPNGPLPENIQKTVDRVKNGDILELKEMDNLGFFFQSKKTPETDRKAAYWYKKAADKCYPTSKIHLGYFYLKGRGVEKDEKKARELFEKAAAKKYPEAIFWLGHMHQEGLGGFEKDPQKALEHYKDCAFATIVSKEFNKEYKTHKYPAIPKRIVEELAEGRLKNLEDDLGKQHTQNALNKIRPIKALWLGRMYEIGHKVTQDIPEAIEHYKESVESADKTYDEIPEEVALEIFKRAKGWMEDNGIKEMQTIFEKYQVQ